MGNKRKFHVVITNNETGEVMMDKQSNGIMAAIEHEEGFAAIVSLHCDVFSVVQLLATARGMCDDFAKDHPKLDKMAKTAATFNQPTPDSEEGAEAGSQEK